jgi:hypothetical protein
MIIFFLFHDFSFGQFAAMVMVMVMSMVVISWLLQKLMND